jgi:hypothetical protein
VEIKISLLEARFIVGKWWALETDAEADCAERDE